MNDINSVIINEPPYEQNPLLQCIAVGIQLWGGAAQILFCKSGDQVWDGSAEFMLR